MHGSLKVSIKTNKIEKFTVVVLILFFITNPLSDFISLILSQSSQDFYRFSLLSRGLFTLLAVFVYFAIILSRPREMLVFFIFFTSIISSTIWVIIGQYNESVYFETINILIKILIFFIFCNIFKYLSRAEYRSLYTISIAVKWSVIVYSLFIMLGPFLELSELRSYGDNRYGYKGIISAQNEASSLLLIGLLIFGVEIAVKEASKIDYIGFLVCSIAAFLLGTKVAIILPLAIVSIIIISRRGALAALPAIFSVMVLFVFSFVLAWIMLPKVAEAVKLSIAYLRFQLENNTNGNIITLLLSGRNYKVLNILENVIYNNPIYLLVGGYPLGAYSAEIDFIDIILVMGLPASVLYFVMLKEQFNMRGSLVVSRFNMLAFIIVLAISSTAGHLLTSALALPYLAYFCVHSSSYLSYRE